MSAASQSLKNLLFGGQGRANKRVVQTSSTEPTHWIPPRIIGPTFGSNGSYDRENQKNVSHEGLKNKKRNSKPFEESAHNHT